MAELTEVTTLLTRLFNEQDTKISNLEESIADKIAQLDSIGWKEIGSAYTQSGGPSIDDIRNLTERLREMAATNPLHVRGAQLRFSYIFGEGLEFSNVKPAARAIMNNPYNKETMFSVTAYENNSLATFTDGNLIVIYDKEDKLFTAVPLEEISGVVLDPNDDSKIRYLKRSRTREGQPSDEWIPLARWANTVAKLPTSMSRADDTPISKTRVAYIKRSRAQTGWTWGVPESLAAMVWSLAYSNYLQDNSKLVRALSMIAWSLTKTTTEGVNAAAAQIVGSNIGGTAVNTTGNAISSVGVPSAQVNMNNGQPLAAMVATSFGVPVIALLSSPGATGGSYGAATTLDGPTIKGMQAIQDSWGMFYQEILSDLGSKDAEVGFPNIESDPAYRASQSIATAYENGLIWDDEARAGTLKLLPVPKLHRNPPQEPPNIQPQAAQGVSGPVSGGTDQDQTNHDGDDE